ncbi:NAD(P)-binding domain-containing protein [Dyella sp. LX-66]|uniref:NAD(P)-binding domain-containing protein n=1 Tax=unclassified Dyella TaxID=2634549 RepID=UPI001BE111DE|nr:MULTISPECIES: NAD(P)-binding domain-containing protein [unclassified Dyella]MBT2117318.1 NAD(P)-binding domain-containing protein [Dyella sp. LX-1]MBT2138382.1 NAD(P)-binding domain-containing protein [Dyella sp. LX-66]
MLGVIGIGAVAAAIVAGLSEDKDPPRILLSPRNAGVAAKLAAAYPNVRVAGSNQEVVDGAGVVLLCVRPADARQVMAELTFGDQSLISVMAGIPIRGLQQLAPSVKNIARAIPLPSVANRRGITPLYPAIEPARSLFGRLGRVIDVADETAFDHFSAATATLAAHFLYLKEISSWLEAKGIAPSEAQNYVAAMFGELATSLQGHDTDFSELLREHATPGGINELFCRVVGEEGVWTAVDLGLGRVRQALHDRQSHW